MQLTRLDIKGFKSFGDKTTIHFNEGVTAIVGPNGCGKSNVVDAIRWVLGEQSTRNLRSEKMENIIFNGTKNRKPAQLAEVSLSFDNTRNILPTSFSHVTITRKLYRSGESEYRLNDVQCRLKDITDLFLDTGIGSNSYAIIELRMVDEIINNKENSRRALFEESSGISKYKVRKKQTFNRLKDTEQDLSRINDLLIEIEKNLKSLESQARKAERYYKIREEYKQSSLSLASLKLSQLQDSLSSVQQKEAAEKERNLAHGTRIQQLEDSLQLHKRELLTEEKNLSLQQKELNQQKSKILAYETEKKIKNEQLRNLTEKKERLTREIEQDRQQHNHARYNVTRINEELFVSEQELSDARNLLEGKVKEVRILEGQQAELKKELDQTASEKNAVEKKLYEVEKARAVLLIQIDALRQESEKNLSENESRASELTSFDRQISELQIQLESLESDHAYYAEEEKNLDEQLMLAGERMEEIRLQLSQETRMLDARQNEYNLTKSLVDNLEGFPESIRYLKKNPKWKNNYPLFSDILYCQENYRVAIENFLESYMNYYVVDELSDALSAIHLLSETSKGKAGFFVLSAVSPSEGKLHAEDENLVSALTIIDVDKKFLPLCEQLLKNVYLERETGRLAEIKLPGDDLIVLDKNGQFIKRPFAISGGSVGLFEGKRIGRAKNLVNLQHEISKLTANKKNLETELTQLQNSLSSLRGSSRKEHIHELLLQINRKNNELISFKTKQEQYQNFISHHQTRKESIDARIREFEFDLAQTEQDLEHHKASLELLSKQMGSMHEQYSEVVERYSQQSAAYNQDNIRLHQLQNKVSGLQKDLEYREAQLENLDRRLAQHETELTQVETGLKELVFHADSSDEDLQGMYRLKDALEQGLSEVEKQYYSARKLITDTEDELRHTRNQKEQSDFLLTELKDKSVEIRMNLHALTERLSVEFSIEPGELTVPDKVAENIEDLQARNSKLKKQLDDFGSINPMAMESYQEMNERYTFIRQEKEDLEQAKSELLRTIQEIDNSAKEKFMAAFNEVRENFIEVFRSLFSKEDTCDILLSDPDNPLDADIQIIAKPKGKKPLSINQLSGGEKTLTATALLFSLYLLKPAPFCIFDEVDAPLDDTNIDKFNNIIREFSNRSQFIIVSHNKKTIASTDIIYGVTMDEQGISRLVAVNMNEVA
jgi:chromosome segregation protein